MRDVNLRDQWQFGVSLNVNYKYELNGWIPIDLGQCDNGEWLREGNTMHVVIHK